MRNAKTLMVALLAVFAFSAVAASVASAALPEFAGGATENKGFSAVSGKAELKASSLTVICEKSTSTTGKIVSGSTKKEGKVTVEFEECYLSVPTNPCGNPTASSGDITTNPLTMTLGYIKKATAKEKEEGKETEVGTSLEGSSFLAEFQCKEAGNTDLIRVKGSVIGKITVINKFENTFKLEFKEASGKQVPTKFKESGAVEDTLTSELSINGGMTYTPSAAVEVVKDTVTLSGGLTEEIIA